MATRQSASAQSSLPDDWTRVPTGRKIGNAVFWILCVIALLIIVGPAIWLAGGVIVRAIHAARGEPKVAASTRHGPCSESGEAGGSPASHSSCQ